jgi:predicted nucleic acid-binding protein
LSIIKKVDLINLETIKDSTFEKARQLTTDIDEFDIPFIALALELESPLWTGDKKLRKGLEKKGIDWILTTPDLTALRT